MILKILKWVSIVLFVLAVSYSLVGIINFKWMYHSANTPKAPFLETGNTQSPTTAFIIFTTYPCGNCKKMYATFKELKEVRKDIRFVTHPIAFEEGETNRLARIAVAAGLQGLFWEMHEALMQHPDFIVTDVFVEETAELYGIDVEKLNADRSSKEVSKIIDKAYKSYSHTGITSIPSFMINDKMYIVDEENIPSLKDLLEITTQAEQ